MYECMNDLAPTYLTYLFFIIEDRKLIVTILEPVNVPISLSAGLPWHSNLLRTARPVFGTLFPASQLKVKSNLSGLVISSVLLVIAINLYYTSYQ